MLTKHYAREGRDIVINQGWFDEDEPDCVTHAITCLLHYAHSLGLDARDLANTAEGRFTKQIDGEG